MSMSDTAGEAPPFKRLKSAIVVLGHVTIPIPIIH